MDRWASPQTVSGVSLHDMSPRQITGPRLPRASKRARRRGLLVRRRGRGPRAPRVHPVVVALALLGRARQHCPGRRTPVLAVKRPARPHKSATQNPIYYGKCYTVALNRPGRARTEGGAAVARAQQRSVRSGRPLLEAQRHHRRHLPTLPLDLHASQRWNPRSQRHHPLALALSSGLGGPWSIERAPARRMAGGRMPPGRAAHQVDGRQHRAAGVHPLVDQRHPRAAAEGRRAHLTGSP
jgi:hypothetical protein